MLPGTGGTALTAIPRDTAPSRVLLEGVEGTELNSCWGGKEGFIKTDLAAELQSQRPARAKKGKLMELTGSKALNDSARNAPLDVLVHFKRKSS